jgi:DNA-binding transcriptional MocR family regulator
MVEQAPSRSRPSILPQPGTISLARGVPAPEMFPYEQLAQCARLAIERHGGSALQYGEPDGFLPLREWVAQRHRVPPEQVIVTPGSFIGLSFIVETLLDPIGRAAVEAPSYDRIVALLHRSATGLVAVARAPDGLDLDRLRGLFEERSRPAFLYLLPTFHNPTGLTLTLGERERLADLAVELDIVVVEDDPYGMLRFDGEPLPTVHSLLRERDADRLAVYVSSFSKTISPGLRVGYSIGPEPLIERLRDRALATYVSPPILAQAELYEYLRSGYLEPHLADLREFLRPRRDALLEAFAQRMPPDARWTRPDGGYFLWLELPGRLDAASLARRAEAEGVSIVPGHGFFAGAGGEHAARLAFSFPSVEEIATGAARLAGLVSELAI